MATGNAPDASSASGAAEVCPVDHKTREAWLERARAHAQAQAGTSTQAATVTAPVAAQPPQGMPRPGLLSWASLWASPSTAQPPSPTVATASDHPYPRPSAHEAPGLGTDRVVSSIPRTTGDDSATTSAATATAPNAACPVNHEVETGADPVSGNWIYPSEKMFFDAMKRKGNNNARVADMAVVVPIHNAVNERAWKEILEWEAPYTGSGPGQCGGPRLHSFAGLSTNMSPRARLNTLLGYSAPFDRHDWIVDRCGTQVEYVIDFYAGRPGKTANPSQPQVSFYLDVRPKLNSWEGFKMRVFRGLGLQ